MWQLLTNLRALTAALGILIFAYVGLRAAGRDPLRASILASWFPEARATDVTTSAQPSAASEKEPQIAQLSRSMRFHSWKLEEDGKTSDRAVYLDIITFKSPTAGPFLFEDRTTVKGRIFLTSIIGGTPPRILNDDEYNNWSHKSVLRYSTTVNASTESPPKLVRRFDYEGCFPAEQANTAGLRVPYLALEVDILLDMSSLTMPKEVVPTDVLCRHVTKWGSSQDSERHWPADRVGDPAHVFHCSSRNAAADSALIFEWKWTIPPAATRN